mmetsp:Transcript_18004/g.23702  ORF Transcript_18004/g.23702 Transcript_18004/m.23702 type:complete len:953 (+) Transcript_18004:80-2938(+)
MSTVRFGFNAFDQMACKLNAFLRRSHRKGLRLLILQYLSVWTLSFLIENSPASGCSQNRCSGSSKIPTMSVKVAQNLGVQQPASSTSAQSSKVGVHQRLRECLGLDPFEQFSVASEDIHSIDPVQTMVPDITNRNDFKGAFINLRIGDDKGAVASWRLGKVNAARLLCLHRFKMWWMKPLHTTKGRFIPPETQLLLAEVTSQRGQSGDEPLYCIFVPMIDGNAKFSVRGLRNDILQLRAETGDLDAKLEYGQLTGLFIGVDSDPFHLLKFTFENIAQRIQYKFGLQGTFTEDEVLASRPSYAENSDDSQSDSWMAERLSAPYSNQTNGLVIPPILNTINEYYDSLKGEASIPPISTPPAFLDTFGWCTWDSFYTQVTPEGVKEGLTSLKGAGFPPKWMVLDDGWQSTTNPDAKNEEQWLLKLTSLKANYKFRNEEEGTDLGDLVKEVKEEFGISHFFVWHALAGYWAGVEKNEEMEKYKITPNLPYSPEKLLQVDTDLWKFIMYTHVMTKKIGMIHPDKIKEFYDEYHSYLAEQGVDGIKVDAQSAVNIMGTGMGGSVKVTEAYHKGLWESSIKRFTPTQSDTAEGTPNLIHCMCHDSEILLLLAGLYSHRPIVRGSDDHYPRDKASHGPHLYNNAFNSLLISFVGLQDWDMFQTNLGKESWIHAASRAISGGPIYISDRPGQHNPKVLSKLVLADGSILRSKHNALPTVKSIFDDPQSSKSLLSLWNTNYLKNSGVLGVFNIQGASWNQRQRKFWFHSGVKCSTLNTSIKPSDIHSISKFAQTEYAVYLHNKQTLHKRGYGESVEISVPHMDFEIATVSPAYKIGTTNGHELQWGAVGLVHMFNSGASLIDQELLKVDDTIIATVSVKGSGKFKALCSYKPTAVFLLNDDIDTFCKKSISSPYMLDATAQKLDVSHSLSQEGDGILEYDIPISASSMAKQTVIHIWDTKRL